VFLLGLAYGLLNEGLIAQTLIRYQHVPVANFDHYVYAAGINFAWTAMIVPWHACMAVMFPIALLGLWFPNCAASQWLGRKTFAAVAIGVTGGVTFLAVVRAPRLQMHLFLLAMSALAALAWLCRGKSAPMNRKVLGRQDFLVGALFYIALVVGATLLAGRKAPAEIYFSFVALVIVGFGWLARRYEFDRLPDAAIVALGAYFVACIFNGLAGFVHHSSEAVVCGTVLSLTFLWLWQIAPRRKTDANLAVPEANL
jgi:hypothetical protein